MSPPLRRYTFRFLIQRAAGSQRFGFFFRASNTTLHFILNMARDYAPASHRRHVPSTNLQLYHDGFISLFSFISLRH